ncbi:hypothetical protein K493DRAFT_407470 [Basidiobolus meristosporus CBS 931.73]|uniref:EF-hand domain-containing protein n=1 Tax=Basidiobolus meristosporus CBS 931.73 TaxID=1314790 RepID=A0A1Y1YDC3_9FUNG|nr:hypothetical protein K493DRAFT_407470 [Basidiobolus meristosporus CBS 931.73]|eukprot:ORX95736.1 hypothetical protein K493DRAFT_407470 [Basidiobolus meristosporus CBS 931.73]
MKLNVALLLALCVRPIQGKFDPEDDHSNYGDMEKARSFVKSFLSQKKLKDPLEVNEADTPYFLFNVYDTDGDGYLDGNELRNGFKEFEEKTNGKAHQSLKALNEYVDHVLGEDDVDGDGKISMEEYLASQEYHESD